jgi:hypothetical protein
MDETIEAVRSSARCRIASSWTIAPPRGRPHRMHGPTSGGFDHAGHVAGMLGNRHVARGALGCARASVIRNDHPMTASE